MKRRMQCFSLNGATSRLKLEIHHKSRFRQIELSVNLLSPIACECLCLLSFGKPEALRNRENSQDHTLINDGPGAQFRVFAAS